MYKTCQDMKIWQIYPRIRHVDWTWKDSKRFDIIGEIRLYLARFYKIWKDTARYYKITYDLAGFGNSAHDFMKPDEILRDLERFGKI